MKRYTTVPQAVILSAVNKIEDYVKCTYGPSGRGVLIDDGFQQNIIDDGFTALEAFELEDELENAVVKYIKDATRKTNKRAGDGTTTTLLLICELVRQALIDSEMSLTKPDYTSIAVEYRKAVDEAVKALKPKKIKTIEDLQRIAQNSYRNPEIASLIATMVHTVGQDGVIAIEDSETLETSSEIVSGLHIDRGYVSPHMSGKDGKPNEMKRPLVVITDEPLTTLEPHAAFLDEVFKAGHRDILFIAETIDGQALTAMVVNKLKGVANIIGIRAPGYGDNRYELLTDIATIVGATVLSKKTARPLASLTTADCGTAETISLSQGETLVIGGAGKDKDIKARIETVRGLSEKGSEFDKQKAKDRIASMSGGVGVIRVGAPTDTEKNAIKEKVTDALNATQHAYKDGVVKGGGEALAMIETSSARFNVALKHPHSILVANGTHFIRKDAEDAAVVITAALESATSVASTLITAGAIITDEREDKDTDD